MLPLLPPARSIQEEFHLKLKIRYREEIEDLKLENTNLKLTNDQLKSEIKHLKEQIVSMSTNLSK